MGMFHLNDNDLAILQKVLNDAKGQREEPPRQGTLDQSWNAGEDHQAPEVYIAKPQTSDGIPKLLPTDGTTGTSEDIAGNPDFDEPGQAVCDIYRITQNDTTGDPELKPISGLVRTVYNIQLGDVAQEWITVARTKFGKWLSLSPGSITVEWAILNETLNEGSSAIAVIWRGGPTVSDLTSSGEQVTVGAPPLMGEDTGTSAAVDSISSGSWILIVKIGTFWWMIGAPC